MNGVPLTYWYTDTEPFSSVRSLCWLLAVHTCTFQCSLFTLLNAVFVFAPCGVCFFGVSICSYHLLRTQNTTRNYCMLCVSFFFVRKIGMLDENLAYRKPIFTKLSRRVMNKYTATLIIKNRSSPCLRWFVQLLRWTLSFEHNVRTGLMTWYRHAINCNYSDQVHYLRVVLMISGLWISKIASIFPALMN